ncbi:MAG: hypothetical protein IJ661_13555 [Lachnospiraceae bacterium]|nr:hypothetical protein [Lachnospiraceae bacterium]
MGINAVSANSINVLSGNQISTKQAGSEIQEKIGQTERETTGIANQYDRMEITSESQTVVPSENYNNIRYNETTNLAFIRGDGKNVFHRNITDYMYQYCQGDFSNDELKQKFKDICNEVYEYNFELNYISETDNEGKLRLISEVYAIFQNGNAGSMAKLCMDAGTGIASQYGNNDIGWVYYDTDYRNKSENIHEFLKDVTNEISKEWAGQTLDFEKIEMENGLLRVSGKDFDTHWNHIARDLYMCSLKDIQNSDFSETVSSGERFSFFYKAVAAPGREGENTLETQKGVILLELGERKWKLDVPFNNSTVLGDLAYNFNVGSLFERYANDNPVMLRLLKHFNVFSLFCRRDII